MTLSLFFFLVPLSFFFVTIFKHTAFDGNFFTGLAESNRDVTAYLVEVKASALFFVVRFCVVLVALADLFCCFLSLSLAISFAS